MKRMVIKLQILNERERNVGGKLWRELVGLEAEGDHRCVQIFSYTIRPEEQALYWGKTVGKVVLIGVSKIPNVYNGEVSLQGTLLVAGPGKLA